MEPDFDQILSKKIRQAEQRPVAWNKQVVWQNVQSETSAGRGLHFFYYVAAAMLGFLIYFAVRPIGNEIESPQLTDAQIESKLKPAEPVTPVIAEKKQDPVVHPTVRKRENTVKLPLRSAPNTVDVARQTPPEIQVPGATVEPLAEIHVPVEDVLPEEVAAPERKIRPVVGIITESRSETVANAKRKKGLRKLHPSEETPWENPGNALVFAMRK